jgi:hypothetical protein
MELSNNTFQFIQFNDHPSKSGEMEQHFQFMMTFQFIFLWFELESHHKVLWTRSIHGVVMYHGGSMGA